MPLATRPARSAGTSRSRRLPRAKWNSRFHSRSVPPSGPCPRSRRGRPTLRALATSSVIGRTSWAACACGSAARNQRACRRCAPPPDTSWPIATGPRSSPGRAATRGPGSATAPPCRRRCCAWAAADEVRDFLAWYATHQAADGNVPCVVDRNGPDWLPEHDSHGQLVFTLAEYFRFTGDRAFTAALWPAAQRAVGYLESLLATALARPSSARQSGARASASCPSRPATRAISRSRSTPTGTISGRCAASATALELAQALGEAAEAERLRNLRDEAACMLCTNRSRRRSLRAASTTSRARLNGPISIPPQPPPRSPRPTPPSAWRPPRWHGPSTSTCAACAGGARGEIDWNNYSAYEIRILGALVRLGRCADAHELLEFFLADRRPQAGTNGPRSRGGIRAAPVISATFLTPGSAPSTCWQCSACLPMSGPADDSARPRSRHLRRVARCRRSGRRLADLVGAAALLDAARGNPRAANRHGSPGSPCLPEALSFAPLSRARWWASRSMASRSRRSAPMK